MEIYKEEEGEGEGRQSDDILFSLLSCSKGAPCSSPTRLTPSPTHSLTHSFLPYGDESENLYSSYAMKPKQEKQSRRKKERKKESKKMDDGQKRALDTGLWKNPHFSFYFTFVP